MTRTGPEEALYVVDMYRGIIQDHVFLSDQLREEALKRGLDKPLGGMYRRGPAAGTPRMGHTAKRHRASKTPNSTTTLRETSER